MHRVLVVTRVRTHQQVLVHGQEREHLAAFGNVADAEPHHPVRRQVVDGLALESHRATLGVQHAGNRAQHCRFAGAVGTQHGDDLALRDLQADAANRLDRAVESLDRGDVEQRRAHPSPPIYARTTSGWFCTSSGVPRAITLP